MIVRSVFTLAMLLFSLQLYVCYVSHKFKRYNWKQRLCNSAADILPVHRNRYYRGVPKDPNQFILCSKGRPAPKTMSCPEGTIFDDFEQRCVPKLLYKNTVKWMDYYTYHCLEASSFDMTAFSICCNRECPDGQMVIISEPNSSGKVQRKGSTCGCRSALPWSKAARKCMNVHHNGTCSNFRTCCSNQCGNSFWKTYGKYKCVESIVHNKKLLWGTCDCGEAQMLKRLSN